MSTTTSSAPSQSWRGPRGPEGRRLNQDAIRFFIVAVCVCTAGMLITLLCCSWVRLRKRKMKNVIIAAFSEGVFTRTEVANAINNRRRGAPVAHVSEEDVATEIPRLWQQPLSVQGALSTRSYTWNTVSTNIQPLAARLRTAINGLDIIKLQKLPVEFRLAQIFEARLELKKELKKSKHLNPNPQPSLSHDTHDKAEHLDGNSDHSQEDVTLEFSVMIAMPHQPLTPPSPSAQALAEHQEFTIGVTAIPWLYSSSFDAESPADVPIAPQDVKARE